MRAAAVFTVGATLLGGVSFASAAALPGDALYGVKRGAESVAIAILPEGVLEREFLFKVADRRAEEIRRLIAEGADPRACSARSTISVRQCARPTRSAPSRPISQS